MISSLTVSVPALFEPGQNLSIPLGTQSRPTLRERFLLPLGSVCYHHEGPGCPLDRKSRRNGGSARKSPHNCMKPGECILFGYVAVCSTKVRVRADHPGMPMPCLRPCRNSSPDYVAVKFGIASSRIGSPQSMSTGLRYGSHVNSCDSSSILSSQQRPWPQLRPDHDEFLTLAFAGRLTDPVRRLQTCLPL